MSGAEDLGPGAPGVDGGHSTPGPATGSPPGSTDRGRGDGPRDAGGDLILRPSIVERLEWGRVFGNGAPVEVELGAGDGSFLVRYAGLRRDRNFLGVERLLGRLRKIDRKARRAGLGHIRCLRLEASYVMRWMIPPGSLAALHLYFPDPWPKRRHWKRRLVQDPFVRDAAAALGAGGMMHVRTDDAGYFEQMTEVFGTAVGRGEFEASVAPAELLSVVTDFEAEFHARGIPTLQASWRRTSAPVQAPSQNSLATGV